MPFPSHDPHWQQTRECLAECASDLSPILAPGVHHMRPGFGAAHGSHRVHLERPAPGRHALKLPDQNQCLKGCVLQ